MEGRISKAKKLLSKVTQIQGGFTKRMEIISTLILATGLYGAEGATVSTTAIQSLGAVTIDAMWGDRQRTRAKEIILCVLLPGHRISPAMKVPYLRITWLAATCKNQRPSQYMIQAIWEQNESPPMTGPVGRALAEIRPTGMVALADSRPRGAGSFLSGDSGKHQPQSTRIHEAQQPHLA